MTLSVSQARRRLWSMNGRRRALRLVEPAAPERTAPLNSCHRPMPMNRLAGCQGHIFGARRACRGIVAPGGTRTARSLLLRILVSVANRCYF